MFDRTWHAADMEYIFDSDMLRAHIMLAGGLSTVAKRSFVARQTLHTWVRGAQPTVGKLAQVASVIGVHPGVFFRPTVKRRTR